MFGFNKLSSLMEDLNRTIAPIAPIAPKLILVNTEVWEESKPVNKCTVVLSSQKCRQSRLETDQDPLAKGTSKYSLTAGIVASRPLGFSVVAMGS